MMNRKIISALMALILWISMTGAVFATSNGDFVFDELDYLTHDEIGELNALAAELHEKTGVGIFTAYVHAEAELDYDVDWITGGMTDYVIMLENETNWWLQVGGRGESIGRKAMEELWQAYNDTATYAEGVRVFMEAAAAYLPAVSGAASNQNWESGDYFVYDGADLLTDSEERVLSQKLSRISGACSAQTVVATVSSVNGSVDNYVDDFYDSMGFGYGQGHDGVLLLVCMNPREYRIISNGYAGTVIGRYEINELCSIMDYYLPRGDYAKAFSAFADQCEHNLYDHLYGEPFPVGKTLLISLVVGLTVGLIVALILKGQLKSVRSQNLAGSYVKKGSMYINNSYDIFLYRNIRRTRKSSESSGHRSSGGSSRSRGGGSF